MAVPVDVFAASDCAAKTRYGTFNGFVDERGVKTWLGIPYAQPPVGKLRWQAPKALKPSNKSFDEKNFGNDPMQASMKKFARHDFSFTAAAHDVVMMSIEYRLKVFGFVNFAEIDSAFEVPAPFQPCC